MTQMTLALALALALGGAAAAAETGPSVSVIGEAEARVAPDRALLAFSVDVEKPTSEAAATESARVARAVIEALKSGGVAEAEIETTGLALWPNRASSTGPQTFRAVQSLRVRLLALPRAGALIGAAVANGGLYESVAYDVSDREAREDALRGSAVENARHRAELYAKGAGLKLGPVRAIVGAGAEPPEAPVALRPRAAGLSRSAEPPVEAGMITLRQSVNVSFDLAAP